MRIITTLAFAAALTVSGTAAIAARTPNARISMPQARAIALRAAPGQVVKAEYRNEGGWRYSFDIRQGRRIHEIGVNAMTGRIVENRFEGPNARK